MATRNSKYTTSNHSQVMVVYYVIRPLFAITASHGTYRATFAYRWALHDVRDGHSQTIVSTIESSEQLNRVVATSRHSNAHQFARVEGTTTSKALASDNT